MLNTAKDSNPSELLSKPAKQEYNAKNTHWAWPALVIIILIENNLALIIPITKQRLVETESLKIH